MKLLERQNRYELEMTIKTKTSMIMTFEPTAGALSNLPMAVKPMHALVDSSLNRIHFKARLPKW